MLTYCSLYVCTRCRPDRGKAFHSMRLLAKPAGKRKALRWREEGGGKQGWVGWGGEGREAEGIRRQLLRRRGRGEWGKGGGSAGGRRKKTENLAQIRLILPHPQVQLGTGKPKTTGRVDSFHSASLFGEQKELLKAPKLSPIPYGSWLWLLCTKEECGRWDKALTTIFFWPRIAHESASKNKCFFWGGGM